MKLYLVRHGETDWNKERRIQGQADIPLNEFGRRLAEKTASGRGNAVLKKGGSFPGVFRHFLTIRRIMSQLKAERIS